MLSSSQIKEKLINDTEKLIDILDKSGFEKIKIINNQIRCAYEESSNPTSVCISLDNMFCTIFSKNLTGDIFTLLEWKLNKNFKDVIRYVSTFIEDEEIIDEIKPKKLLFNGFFKQFIGYEQYEQIYNESVLKEYKSIPNIRFLSDNISCSTQRKFEIGYDYKTHRITIPWRSIDGNLVGVSSRNNDDCSDAPKYLALKSFKKSNHLYGMFQNYNEIVSKRKIIIVESEKSVLQAYDMDIKNMVAVGCHSISENQINLLKFNVDMVTIMFDKDVAEDEVKEQCKKIKDKLGIKVYYCIDSKDLLNEKESVTDRGINIFMELCKQIKEYKEVKKDE